MKKNDLNYKEEVIEIRTISKTETVKYQRMKRLFTIVNKSA